MTVIPFGKHKGKEVSELPIKYLHWLDANVKLYGELAVAVGARLGKPVVPTAEREIEAREYTPFGDEDWDDYTFTPLDEEDED